MNGGPWHCGFPMNLTGGYQCGGTDEWVAFHCAECGHQQTLWGHVHTHKNGDSTFVPRPPKVLSVLFEKMYSYVRARGICEDVTLFGFIHYSTYAEAIEILGRHYSARGYRCVFNMPKEEA